MNSENTSSVLTAALKKHVCEVTSVSKIVAAIVFICLPFVGFLFGMESHQPVQTIMVTAPVVVPRTDSTITSADLVQKLKDYEYNFVSEYVSSFPSLMYVALDGKTEKYGLVVRESTFSFQDKVGSVKEVCERQTIVQHVELRNTCLGSSSLVLSWDGKESELLARSAVSLNDVWSLIGVGFTEGKFSRATSSDKETTNLVIYESPQNCLTSEGLCGGGALGAHTISFPYRGLVSLSAVSLPGVARQYYWNKEGTKAVYAVGCVEGCPEEIFLGVTLKTGVQSALVTEQEGEDRFVYSSEEYKNVTWIDEDTVQIGTTEKTF